jgi:hypothetical protein
VANGMRVFVVQAVKRVFDRQQRVLLRFQTTNMRGKYEYWLQHTKEKVRKPQNVWMND